MEIILIKLEGIADKLGAAIGASRAAVDAGFVKMLTIGKVGQTQIKELIAPENLHRSRNIWRHPAYCWYQRF